MKERVEIAVKSRKNHSKRKQTKKDQLWIELLFTYVLNLVRFSGTSALASLAMSISIYSLWKTPNEDFVPVRLQWF